MARKRLPPLALGSTGLDWDAIRSAPTSGGSVVKTEFDRVLADCSTGDKAVGASAIVAIASSEGVGVFSLNGDLAKVEISISLFCKAILLGEFDLEFSLGEIALEFALLDKTALLGEFDLLSEFDLLAKLDRVLFLLCRKVFS